MHYFPALPRTLKSLDLSKNYSLGLYLEQPDETYDLPLLESFKCESTYISGALLNALILKSVKSGNLKRLDISRTNVDPETYAPGSSEYLASPTVEELSLAGLTSNAGTASMLGERHIIAIVKCYPNVKELDVSRTKVTGVAVKQFVSMGIKWLNLSECTEVGRDAVEYAQGKGVEVEFKFPSRGGRTTFRELYN
jgi:F-box/TPR repeat protein Pof3